MADWRDELEKAREEARRARDEANRLRQEAREMEHRLRQEGRDRSREERHRERAERHAFRAADRASRAGPEMPPPPGWSPETAEGARSQEDFSLEGVTSVVVDQTAGRVTIRPCREGETPGVISSGNKSAPRVEVVRDGDRLLIEIKLSTGWLFRRKQGATTLVRLAQRVEHLRLDLGYGEAHLREIDTESIRLDVGAGTITTAQTSGSLRANVGAGKVAIHGHSGLADCDTGTGDVLVDISRLAEGEYRIDAGIGRAEVRLPPGGQVFIKASSGMGKTRIDYPGAPEGAPTTLKINTGVGEVNVKTRQPSDESAPPPPPAMAKPQRGGRGPQPRRREAEELRVLQLLEQGRITSQEAADLIAALQGAAGLVELDDLENGAVPNGEEGPEPARGEQPSAGDARPGS